MVEERERTSQERETLIFPTREAAQEWQEQFGEQLRRGEGRVVRRRRELLREELAREFERQGEGVGLIAQPWEHTTQEHAEVQHLVDIAFARDLPAALKAARSSEHYPRNIDLFHDVLTTEMYELLQEHKLNRQPLSLPLLLTVITVVAALVVMLWLFITP